MVSNSYRTNYLWFDLISITTELSQISSRKIVVLVVGVGLYSCRAHFPIESEVSATDRKYEPGAGNSSQPCPTPLTLLL